MALPDSKIDEAARQIGVDPEALLEARAEARIERHKRGQPTDRGTDRLCRCQVFMPEVIFKAWKEECANRDLQGSALLRSIVHAYLVGRREPVPLKVWKWEGKRYRMGPNGERAPFRERAFIPIGAKRALTRRAELARTIPTAILRALVMELLMGEHRALPIVEHGMMYDDEERYLS